MKASHMILMVVTSAVWGFNFVATRVALEVFSAEQMAFARSVLTLAILLPWWKPMMGIPWKLVAAALSIGTLSFYLLYLAVSVTESLTTVAVVTQLMPALSAILALVFYQEQISTRKWAGILIASLGAAFLAGVTKSSLSLMALGLTFLAVLSYSAGSVVIGKTASVGIWRMLAWIAAVSIPPLGLLALASGPLYPDPGLMAARHWLAMLFAVLFSALFGQAVLFNLYRKFPVSDVAPWALFVPLFAGLSAILVYDESITFNLILGGAVVVSGVWVQHRSDRKTTVEPSTL